MQFEIIYVSVVFRIFIFETEVNFLYLAEEIFSFELFFVSLLWRGKSHFIFYLFLTTYSSVYIFFVYFKYDKDFKKMKQLFTSAKVFERISLGEIFPEVKLYIFFCFPTKYYICNSVCVRVCKFVIFSWKY